MEGIDQGTRLTRYMSLPTFLLLLAGKVFIPTLTTLRETDRLESNVPQVALPDYWKYVEEMLAPVEDWLIKLAISRRVGQIVARSSKLFPHLPEELRLEESPDSPHSPQTMATLIESWIHELARRRCIWCWNKETEESHALWRLYGNKGIAVVSSVSRIFDSLNLPARVSGSVSQVFYVPNPMSEEKISAHADVHQKLISSAYLPRPYYFKEIGYRYEHEVSFAFAVDGVLLGLGSARGVLVEISPKKLIENMHDVRISPHVLKDEAQVIQKLIERSLGENTSIDLSLDLTFPSAKLTELFVHPFDRKVFFWMLHLKFLGNCSQRCDLDGCPATGYPDCTVHPAHNLKPLSRFGTAATNESRASGLRASPTTTCSSATRSTWTSSGLRTSHSKTAPIFLILTYSLWR